MTAMTVFFPLDTARLRLQGKRAEITVSFPKVLGFFVLFLLKENPHLFVFSG